MKKFLFFALAAAFSFTRCTKDETLATAQNGAIAFAPAADKATRSNVDPSTTTANITNFKVYGFMNDYTGLVFSQEGEKVTGSNTSGWSYQNTQYWTPNTYYFAAIAPAEGKWSLTPANSDEKAKLGVGQVAFTNEGTQDLLYWAGISENRNGESENAPVSIVFNHLLSKVKFSFVNRFDNANARIVVKDIKITNAYDNGSVDLAVADWWSTPSWTFANATTSAREFGNAIHEIATNNAALDVIEMGAQHESDKELLLFPVSAKEFNITFIVELYMGETLADTYNHNINLTTTLEMGKAYDFKAEIDASNVAGTEDGGLKPIEFEVTVKEWDEVEEIELYTNHKNTEVAAGQTLTLTNNGVIVGTMNVAGTLDGANNVLMTEAVPTNNGMIRPTGTATIKNVTLDGKGRRTADDKSIRGFYINAGAEKVTIDNVKILNCGYALNVGGEAAPAALELIVSNSTFEGWTSYTSTVNASFTKVNFTRGSYEKLVDDNGNLLKNGWLRPYGATVLTDCTFEEGYTIDLGSLVGKTVKFVNCTYGTTAITAANINTLGFVENYDASKVEF